MKNRWLIVAAVMLCSVYGSGIAARAQAGGGPGKAKEDDVRQFLKLTGAGELGVQMSNQMFGSLRKALPQVPEDVWKEITDEFRTEFSAERMIELNVPIIAKHYTGDEIKQLTAFYQSPLGKKVISVTPLIAQEGYTAGAQRGQEIMQRLIQKLRSKGYGPPVG